MQEFIASKKNDKNLYRRTRRKYKRWIWGNLAMLLCFVIGIGLFLWVSAESGEGFSSGVIIVGIGIAIIPIAVGFVFRALAVSGGREVLLNRISDKIVLYDNYLSMEYVPHARESMEFHYIQYQIPYRDIRTLEYQEKFGRLQISGDYQIIRYGQPALGEVPGNVEIEQVSDGAFYVYAHYDAFEFCMDQIYKMSGLRK